MRVRLSGVDDVEAQRRLVDRRWVAPNAVNRIQEIERDTRRALQKLRRVGRRVVSARSHDAAAGGSARDGGGRSMLFGSEQRHR